MVTEVFRRPQFGGESSGIFIFRIDKLDLLQMPLVQLCVGLLLVRDEESLNEIPKTFGGVWNPSDEEVFGKYCGGLEVRRRVKELVDIGVTLL